MSKRRKLVRLDVLPDVRAGKDTRDGKWHVGWRWEGSDRIAFHYRGEWFAMMGPPPIVKPQPIVNQEDAVFWRVKDHPDYMGIPIIFQEIMPGLFVNTSPDEATRYAGGRAQTTLAVWAESQPAYPGGWSALQPKFFPRA